MIGASLRRLSRVRWKIFALALALVVKSQSAEIPKAPVPKSPYLPVVYRFADTMLKYGRDTYGPQKTGLFLSALDRGTLAPLTNRPPKSGRVQEVTRVGGSTGPLVGANPQHDENLLRLLYTLSELSGKPQYRQAADDELKWFLEHARSTNTQLLAWGDYLSWNVLADEIAPPGDRGLHKFFRPWMLWDRCFRVAPDASKAFAIGLWEHQIGNHTTGGFNQSAGFSGHSALDSTDPANHAGFYIRTWAAAYAHTREEKFLHAIEVLLGRFEKKRHPATALIPSYGNQAEARVDWTLSLAIDCDGAAHHVPEPLAGRLRAFAAREDELVCAQPHNLNRTNGFLFYVKTDPGKRFGDSTRLWRGGGGYTSTAQFGMLCVSRYDNTGKVGYRDLILGAADAYLNSLPADAEDVWPMTFGHAISLELAAWRHSADWKYMERARQLGDVAVEEFWGTNALPRASLKTDQYESITGADTLALALLELHLNVLHITAVRPPPNTIDR